MMKNSCHTILLGMVVALCLNGTVSAGVIYSDDFSGSGSTDLNGLDPDTRPGSETWIASTTAPAWKADGSIVDTAGSRNAWLPFSPATGTIYTLSLDVNPNTSSGDISDWFALGFTGNPQTTNSFQGTNATAWMLQRVRRSGVGDVQTFLGPGTASGVSHDTAAGTVNLKVVLDTNPANWTAEWFFQGLSIRGPVAFGANPTITHVGIGKYNSAGGVVDNFQLSSNRETITDLYNTGVDSSKVLLGGSVDDGNYEMIGQPPVPGNLTDQTLATPPGAWLANSSVSRWIGPDIDTTGNGPEGDYTYRTTFTLPANADLSTVLVSGSWATDNGGTDILINGVSTGQTSGGFGSLTTFTISSDFVTGTNTIDFVLNNASPTNNPTGLRVEGIDGSYIPIPEPATLSFLAFGAVALISKRRRQQSHFQE